MIKINAIAIEEFRGIRNLTLNLEGKNFAICGPNGTGKSGIVDALEFGLSGKISRLSGEGQGEISLKEHAPHVDKRNDPQRARVVLTVFIPSLNQVATIERNAKQPSVARITPDDPAILALLKKVENHPEIALSRRQLIKYVLATPGKRAQEVQALLHLDRIESVRSSLQKIAKNHERDEKLSSQNVDSLGENLKKGSGVASLSAQSVLGKR